MSDEVKEVLDTFRVCAELRGDSLGAYVISMAHHVRFFLGGLFSLWTVCVVNRWHSSISSAGLGCAGG